MAARASRAMSQKRPDKPRAWVMRGPVTMAMAKVMPKLTPMKAIALVRFCSRVRSDRSAMTAAEMAPLPCRARPTMTPDGVAQGGDDAAKGKHQQAADDEGLRPPCRRAGRRDLEQGLGHAVDADGKPDERLGGARQGHAVGGQHRQHHKHAEHAQREDGAAQVASLALVMVKSFMRASMSQKEERKKGVTGARPPRKIGDAPAGRRPTRAGKIWLWISCISGVQFTLSGQHAHQYRRCVRLEVHRHHHAQASEDDDDDGANVSSSVRAACSPAPALRPAGSPPTSSRSGK
jgi:hypothetical protein